MQRLSCAVLSIAFLMTAAASLPTSHSQEPKDDRPFFALWRSDHGWGGAPALRFAFWNDGRVLFAKDSGKWGSELQQGRVASYRIERLKQALSASGVFTLKGNCYLVPDAGVDCLMVEVGDKKQMLYWDEVEAPGHGINIKPKPHHLEFIRCWKLLNSLGVVACPDQYEASKREFEPTKSWYLKPAIQSE
jgi:hypothetical protein